MWYQKMRRMLLRVRKNDKGDSERYQRRTDYWCNSNDKGTSNGTITDFDSNFTLDVAQGEEIEISYIGYKTQIVKPGNRTVLSITLLEDAKILEEVVVVGYGKQSEKLLTTSISSMKVDDIDQGNDYNVAKMLQGRTPGVNVSTASGIPGEQPNVRVRGVASISGDATPLYVVDGVPSDNMPYLNPNDIERMDVLKDASATAIYGSRANNGVIIITTKSGKMMKRHVSTQAYVIVLVG